MISCTSEDHTMQALKGHVTRLA